MGDARLLHRCVGDALGATRGDERELPRLKLGLHAGHVLGVANVGVTALLHKLSHEAVAHLRSVELAWHTIQSDHSRSVSVGFINDLRWFDGSSWIGCWVG